MKNEYITIEKTNILEQEMQEIVTHLRNLSNMNHTHTLYKQRCAETLLRARQLSTQLMQWQVLLACEAQEPDSL